MVISCKSTDNSATGIAVVDVQQYFLIGALVSSTVKGKMFSVKTVNLDDFKTIITKTATDFQTAESYFKTYDSFSALYESLFKTKTGYQKAYDLTKSQVDQLVANQNVLLAYERNGRKRSLFANTMLLSAGLAAGPLDGNSTTSETFTTDRFLNTTTIGSKIIQAPNDYSRLGVFFSGPSTRSTAITQGSQVLVSSYDQSGTTGGYSYNYPLPPSPAPIFDAPAWYWHQFNTPSTGQTFTVFPTNASAQNFTITNFGTSSIVLDKLKKVTITNGAAEILYDAAASTGEIGPKTQTFELKNGWESTFTFSAQSGQRIAVATTNPANGAYRYFGVLTDATGTFGVALMSPKSVTTLQKAGPAIFNNGTHKLRVALSNKAGNAGSKAEIYMDDALIYSADDSNTLSFVHEVPMLVSILAFNNPAGAGQYKVLSWSFKTY